MFFDKNGEISQSGARLVRNAVFAKAYPNRAAIERMAEATDSNVRNVTNGMLRSANHVAQMQEAIDRGDRYPLSISEDIGKAAGVIDDLRTGKRSVDDWLKQEHFDGRDPVLDRLVRIFSDEGRRPKVIAETIQNYVDGIERAGNPNQTSMFASRPPTKVELLEEAYDAAKRTAERDAAGRRKSSASEGALSLHRSGDAGEGRGPVPGSDRAGAAAAGGESGAGAKPGVVQRLTIERGKPLPDSDEQATRESTIAQVESDPEHFLAEYTRRFGNVLNADNAATLFDRYNRDPAKYRVAVHPAAQWIRDELFHRALGRR